MAESTQSAIAAALLDPARPAPAALAPAGDRRPNRRFAVYRNNVTVGLIDALTVRFPAVRKIVGEAFFAGLARDFVRAHPPRSPLMTVFGDAFPGFVEQAPGLEEQPYLADVARLEAARTRAYHAADAEPLGPEAFAQLDPNDLDPTTIAVHPSLEILRSAHPVVTIWAMNAGAAPLEPIADWSGEDALVVRPRLEVLVRRLPPGGAAFLDALSDGKPLGAAAEAGGAAVENFDLTANLVGLLDAGLCVGLGRAALFGDAP